jgi:hypothetical protein
MYAIIWGNNYHGHVIYSKYYKKFEIQIVVLKNQQDSSHYNKF